MPASPAMRSGRRSLAALAGALALVATGSLAAWGQPSAAGTRTGAGPLTGLDFLLGDFSCAYTDVTLPEPTTVTVEWKTVKTLDDKFYEMVLTGSTPPFEGRWVFGRNAIDDEFLTFYWDTWGNTGHAVSRGWKSGMIRFQGPYVTPAGRADSKDEFRIVDADRFTDDAYIRFPGQAWKQISHVDCRRN